MISGAEKLPESKIPPVPRLPTIPTPEKVPVIPLSDSPPPSRWKPDQKPWKPSYIHIQEIKAKVASSHTSSIGKTIDSITEKVQTSAIPKSGTGDADGGKARQSARHSRSRVSRSKSDSRSYSRSRSRSSSRYKSRSPSFNRSDSENSQKTRRNKRNSLDKEWKKYYSSLSRIKNLDKYISIKGSQDSLSGSEKGTVSEHSRVSEPLENITEKESSHDTKHYNSVPAESFNSKTEWDSDSDKVSQSNSAVPLKQQKQAAQSSEFLNQKLSSLAGWNSESDPENVTSRTLAISEKEEGEASSESDYETSRNISDTVDKIAAAAAVSSGRSGDTSENAAEQEKRKSKKKAKRKHKHKRRGENKSSSHHSKDKAKKSKRKHQKLKESFHWQPPLEFGEEEEDDESKRERHSPGRVKEHPSEDVTIKDENSTCLNQKPSKEEEGTQQRSKESCSKNTKRPEPDQQSSNRKSVISTEISSIKEQQSLDEMDICTPEHNVEIVEAQVMHDPKSNGSELTQTSTSKSSEMTSNDSTLPQSKEQSAVSSTAASGKPVFHFKWKPLKGMPALQNASAPPANVKNTQSQESQNQNTQGVRMEIKSKSRVRPGSLFDEVRKTARLNQRPRNQESSSEERSPSVGKTRATSRTRSPKESRSRSRNSRSVSSHRSHSRGWSRSYSRSRSRSHSSSYSSR